MRHQCWVKRVCDKSVLPVGDQIRVGFPMRISGLLPTVGSFSPCIEPRRCLSDQRFGFLYLFDDTHAEMKRARVDGGIGCRWISCRVSTGPEAMASE